MTEDLITWGSLFLSLSSISAQTNMSAKAHRPEQYDHNLVKLNYKLIPQKSKQEMQTLKGLALATKIYHTIFSPTALGLKNG